MGSGRGICTVARIWPHRCSAPLHYRIKLSWASLCNRYIFSDPTLVTRTVAPRRLKNASITHSPYLRPTFDPKSESNRLSDTRTNKMRQKGDQFTNAPFDRPLIAICSHFCCPGTPLANKKRNIFFVRHTGARATILRMESESYPPSPRIRFFVRFLCALRAPWRLNRE